ncbi:hypothetical protein BGC_21440 [Burkholderia sp. 3C]
MTRFGVGRISRGHAARRDTGHGVKHAEARPHGGAAGRRAWRWAGRRTSPAYTINKACVQDARWRKLPNVAFGTVDSSV